MSRSAPTRSSAANAAENVAAPFRAHGWVVDLEPSASSQRPDLVVSKDSLRYAVELKSASEGRPDRVLALLSQAILEARRHAEDRAMLPLAIVYVGKTTSSLQEKVEQFRHDYAPDVAIGLVSEAGGSRFIGQGLDALNVEAPRASRLQKIDKPRKASELFSDLNQWMLKVLLAPELPESQLNAPRGEYCSGTALADAAKVSTMSASRFVRRLQEEGFLEDSSRSFRLVRRRELFIQWKSASMRSSPELRMTYLIPGNAARQLHKAVSNLQACVGVFAAADMLNLGHVTGVLPYVYVRRLIDSPSGEWPGLLPAAPGEPAQLILKQSNAPEALFRAAVRMDGVRVSDLLQIWLDASAHPSRGAEQANFLRDTVLASVLGAQE